MTIDGNQLSLILGIVGGLLGLFSIGIGLFSMWLSWKLYLAGNQAQIETMKTLVKVESTTKRTEFTQRDVSQTLLTAFINQLGSVSSSVTTAQHRATEKIRTILDGFRAGSSEEEVAKMKSQIIRELASSFGTVKEEAVIVSRLADSQSVAPAQGVSQAGDVPPPALLRLLKWMHQYKSKLPYFGRGYVHKTIFDGDPAIAAAIEMGTQLGVLIEKKRENPSGQGNRITEIVLNYEHPIVQKFLRF